MNELRQRAQPTFNPIQDSDTKEETTDDIDSHSHHRRNTASSFGDEDEEDIQNVNAPNLDTSPETADDRQCRICFAGAEEEPTSGRLISPCKCKGTMKYVHLNCLNEWRRVAPKQTVYFQCENCKYKYHFRRTAVAKWIMNEVVITSVAFLMLFMLAFVGGFMMKLYLMWEAQSNPPLQGWVADKNDQDVWYLFEEAFHPSSLWRIDVAHFLSGFITIGIFGCVSLLFSLFTSPFGMPRLAIFKSGRGGDSIGTIMLFIVIFIGIIKTFYHLYKGIKWLSRNSLQHVENAILEVDD